jgi:group I intron endonuclease
VNWYSLDKQGYIVKDNYIIRPLLDKPCIYVYKLSINQEEKLYIGSTINMVQRFRQHRYRAEIHAINLMYNTKFYNYVVKYGWINFKFGVILYKDIDNNLSWHNKREILLKSEQEYLNKYSPDLNTNKIAGSMLGFKHFTKGKLKFDDPGNKFDTKKSSFLSIKPSISKETILKLKLHNKDITVSILAKDGLLVKQFNRIKAAAEFVGLSPSSVSGYIKNGKLWKNKYYFKLKVNTILDSKFSKFLLDDNMIKECKSLTNKSKKSYGLMVIFNDKVIYKFRSIREASLNLNISKVTLMKYSTENKLWKHKFKFRINSNN